MGGLLQAIAARRAAFLQQREAEGIQSLIDHSQAMVDNGLVETNKDGTKTSIYTVSLQDERLNGGRETVIPSFWDGKRIDINNPEGREKVIQLALASGKTWPSGDTIAEAQAVDEFAHSFIRKQVVGEE